MLRRLAASSPPAPHADEEYAITSYELAKRVVFSRTHTVLYSTVIAAGVWEVLWILLPTRTSGIGGLPDHWLFGAVETYVTLGLLGEIVLRLLLQRHDFWRSRANLFDAGVVGISLLSSLLYYAGAQTRIEALFAEVLVVARVVFRLLRLLTATKSLQRQQQAVDQKLEVRFGTEGGGGSSEVLGLADDGFDEDDHERSSLLLMQQLGEPDDNFHGLQPRFAAVGDCGERGDEYV